MSPSAHTGTGPAIAFVGCLAYAYLTHGWPWWLVGAATVSLVFTVVEIGFERRK